MAIKEELSRRAKKESNGPAARQTRGTTPGKTTTGVEFVYRGASQFDEPGIIVVFEVSN